VTNEDGNYGFVGLPPGEFTVADVLPPRWQQTAPGPQAELLETSSRQLTTDGAALDFGIVDVAAENDGRRWLALDVTLEVLWPSTAYALVPDATSVTVDGDTIFVELLGGDTGLPGLTVLTPETETVHVPRLTPGTYSVVATLNETAGPVLPAFFESWLAEGTVALRADGVHEVTLAAGEVVEGVDFGNRPRARVIRRQIFYNDSEFDGDGPAVNMLDDVVIVHDKQPLLPGEKATWANYTNYVHGINGVVVDLDGVTDPAALGADDFELRVGNDHDPSQWPAAPDPLSITIHPGDGAEGSDRVMISWADGAIVGQWLRVTVKANDDTGLDADDTFYFGNAPGESGNSDSDALVTAADIVSARDVVGLHGASIQHRYDFNRDRQVDAADSVIVRNHVTSPFNALRLIEPPGPANGQGGNGEAEPAPAVLPPVQLDALLAAPTNSGGELTNDSRPAIEPADRDAVWVELARSPLGRLLERSDAATRPGRPTLPVAATPVDEPLLERLASEWVALP